MSTDKKGLSPADVDEDVYFVPANRVLAFVTLSVLWAHYEAGKHHVSDSRAAGLLEGFIA